MNHEPLGGDEEQKRFTALISHFDAPAYLRRARAMQDALAELDGRCSRQREEWLKMPQLRIGRLILLAGAWERLAPLVATAEDLTTLRTLHETLSPTLRAPVERTPSDRQVRAELRLLIESLERFNRRFAAFLAGVELTQLNSLIDSYNRNYVFEKECAVRSPRLARHGFQPMSPMSHDDLKLRHPMLPVPKLRAGS